MANIADCTSPADANTFVEYEYLGASMVVGANHPAVPGGLRLTYDAAGNKTYGGLDPASLASFAVASRFGRVAWQSWMRTGTAALGGIGSALK